MRHGNLLFKLKFTLLSRTTRGLRSIALNLVIYLLRNGSSNAKKSYLPMENTARSIERGYSAADFSSKKE